MTSTASFSDKAFTAAHTSAVAPRGVRVFEALARAARGNASRRAQAAASWKSAGEPCTYLTLAPAFRGSCPR
jgi:hypothetical protein